MFIEKEAWLSSYLGVIEVWLSSYLGVDLMPTIISKKNAETIVLEHQFEVIKKKPE